MTGNGYPITNFELSRRNIRTYFSDCTTSFVGWNLRKLGSWEISCCRHVIGMAI
jgi:hypothetical protein